ncbi:MAG: Inner membrane protein [Chlamydiae bacterium]|nr:Inner membrane protein [Chlamydiota bacterium]
METIVQFIMEHSHMAHWYIFSLLMLAGFNLPISEDLLIILGGTISATLNPENTAKIFICIFLGAYFSDWIVYWLGRIVGPKLQNVRPFKSIFKKNRLEKIQHFYKKYGFLTLLFGRFIPFGFRNALFMTAGMSKMHFLKFILADGIACLVSNSVLFYLSFTLGKNYEALLGTLKIFNVFLFSLFALFIIGFIWYKKKKNNQDAEP